VVVVWDKGAEWWGRLLERPSSERRHFGVVDVGSCSGGVRRRCFLSRLVVYQSELGPLLLFAVASRLPIGCCCTTISCLVLVSLLEYHFVHLLRLGLLGRDWRRARLALRRSLPVAPTTTLHSEIQVLDLPDQFIVLVD
jgi:hypothetical protein